MAARPMGVAMAAPAMIVRAMIMVVIMVMLVMMVLMALAHDPMCHPRAAGST